MAANRDALAGKRLDSWKEIAAFFGRDERTVKRWEKERGLPVHRVPGSARGGVFAYAEELAEWLTGSESSGSPSDPIAGSALAPILPSRAEDPGPLIAPVVLSPQTPLPASRTALLWVLPIVLVGAAIFLFSTGHRPRFRAPVEASAHLPNPEAQDLYLKGRYYWTKRTPEDLGRAVDYFTQAIVRDPAYANAYVGLADCYNLLREYGTMPPSEAFPRALAAAQKAVELDPRSAEAHTSLGFAVFWGDLNIAEAAAEFERAIELDPQNAQAHHWYATFLAESGHFPKALAEIELARQLEPSSKAILADKGFILASAGRTDEAFALLRQLEKSDPEFESIHSYLGTIYFDRGEYSQYFQEEEAVARLRHDLAAQNSVAAEQKIFAKSGVRGLWESRLHSTQERYAQGDAADYELAVDYAQLGRKPEALRHLEIAYRNKDRDLCPMRVDTELATLHGEPEFQQLLAKLGFAPLN
jgi:tetratricopeptide (TPR) repeat protein